MFARTVGDNHSTPGPDAGSPGRDDGLALVRALGGTADDGSSAPSAQPLIDEEIALAQAHRMLAFIGSLKDCFPAMQDLAEHPGWEIMLHLFIAGREGKTPCTADLCNWTGAWRPLAIRYIEMLFERGLIDRDVSGDKPDAWPLSLTTTTDAHLGALLCNASGGFAAQGGSSATN